MISLSMKPEPFDIELVPGVVVTVKPLTTFSFSLAQARAREKLKSLSDSSANCIDAGLLAAEDYIDLHDRAQADTMYEILLGKELAQGHIIAWKGVVDDDSQLMPVNEASISAFIEIYPFSVLFQQEIQKGMRRLFQAKKEFGVAPSGSSNPAPAPNTASSAGVKSWTVRLVSWVLTINVARTSKTRPKRSKKSKPGN